MIDKDKLFNLFGNPEENKDSKIILTVDEDFLEEPFAKLGMFTKLIVNHNVFHNKLSKFLKNEKANIEVAETKRASQYTVFKLLISCGHVGCGKYVALSRFFMKFKVFMYPKSRF